VSLDRAFPKEARKVHDRPINKGRNEGLAFFTLAAEGWLLGSFYVWNCLENQASGWMRGFAPGSSIWVGLTIGLHARTVGHVRRVSN